MTILIRLNRETDLEAECLGERDRESLITGANRLAPIRCGRVAALLKLSVATGGRFVAANGAVQEAGSIAFNFSVAGSNTASKGCPRPVSGMAFLSSVDNPAARMRSLNLRF